ncbi:MAG: hypothetical protein AVDCRST_MAG53-1980, partial [uncultured Solirubrobacteraceae bacterium]
APRRSLVRGRRGARGCARSARRRWEGLEDERRSAARRADRPAGPGARRRPAARGAQRARALPAGRGAGGRRDGRPGGAGV